MGGRRGGGIAEAIAKGFRGIGRGYVTSLLPRRARIPARYSPPVACISAPVHLRKRPARSENPSVARAYYVLRRLFLTSPREVKRRLSRPTDYSIARRVPMVSRVATSERFLPRRKIYRARPTFFLRLVQIRPRPRAGDDESHE